jgi:MFS family permease
MSKQVSSEVITVMKGIFYYGWVVVAACALMIAITFGVMFSYSVFFKPLADYFHWDRATVSLIYSASSIILGDFALVIGWLADRYGYAKLSLFCGFMVCLGLILSSQIQTIWQFFLTYAVIESIGLSGSFGIGMAMVSKWFTKKRGIAIGILSSGSGLGTLLIVPGTERLINAFDWSRAFVIIGIAAGVLMITMSFLLRLPPKPISPIENKPKKILDGEKAATSTQITLGQALKDSQMILIMAAAFLFCFSMQMVMIHLVNYATDMGINPLTAATFISLIGAVSIAGRLSTGIGSDKAGLNSTLILTRVFLVISLLCLIFSKSLWSFYLFAVIFGLCYGGEIPQIPLFIAKHWGTKAMATLVGLNSFIVSIGGALGPWVAGEIFDITNSYQEAFIIGAIAGLVSLLIILILIQIDKNRLRSENTSVDRKVNTCF